MTYTHEKDLRGRASWNYERNIFEDFSFDIEYDTNSWYPVNKNGVISTDGQWINTVNKHWTEYPHYTRIGWRGPMIDWKDVLNSSLIVMEN